MELKKFENIVKKNFDNKEEAEICVNKFYDLLGMDPGSEIMNLPQVLGPLFLKKNFLAIHIPLRDKEVGAFCFKGNYEGGYIILNSSLPRYNVNFALCHEICHVCVNNDIEQYSAEVYVDATYLDHKNERIANQFAGMILMPERHMRRMYEKFKSELMLDVGKYDATIVIVCKLMSYFRAPYMSVLIRLKELGLMENNMDIQALLDVKPADIEKIYDEFWLDKTALRPTYRDDYVRLRELLTTVGKENLELEITYENDLKETLNNLDILYSQIREEV